ncbi:MULTISPECIES: hypothetical protein [unclassified Fusibacter]|uniref:hypothetical protein n=1 Tax=unclassified Fusibacter TaxID=2624464 RepID=UPI001012C76B|nr:MULTISPECIES: hypothetical protein [unclassified Fusibacter]MCK8060377.1 hypothetical protein [Fusibacter sp. A2]NPE20334.1 hypothetical protein [Fusibacter sp. A1]RXV63540.1 hypothetical protein DWB64_00780 [Fusibacter sp. A1]
MYEKELKQLQEEKWFVVHLSDRECNVCEIVGMKLVEELDQISDATYVPLSTNLSPELIKRYDVTQFPTVLFIYGNKIYKRYERVFSISDMMAELRRYIDLSN